MASARQKKISTLLKRIDVLNDKIFDLAEYNYDEDHFNLAARDFDAPPSAAYKKRNKIIDNMRNTISRLKKQLSPLQAAEKADAKKSANKTSNIAKKQASKITRAAKQAKKAQAVKKVENKTKLKKLSLRGRGGGGSMKMPQEYAKPSLFRKN